MKTSNSNLLKAFVFGFLAITAVGCDSDDDAGAQPDTFYGPPVQLGDGTVTAFVKVDEQNNPTEIGIEFPETALEGLPEEMQHFQIQLPQKANLTPFKFIGFDWNPDGHEPEGVYDLPHFDIHFYMMNSAEVMQIGANDPLSEKLPETRFMPASYVALPGSVPMMGKHWADPSSPELNGATFTETFLMGSYNEKVTFYEPMITIAYLEEKESEVIDLPLPQAYHETGKYYPTEYEISFDEETEMYTVSLTGLTKR